MEYDTCEDCMGTGGHRDPNGEGSCFACGGKGRIASDTEAQEYERERYEQQQDALYARLERQYDEGYYDDDY